MATGTKPHRKLRWDTTPEDHKLIRAIAARAKRMYDEYEIERELIDITMDISAVHLNGCPLQLRELAKASDFEFMHDVDGMARHIDRTTGELKNCFLPRFAAPER